MMRHFTSAERAREDADCVVGLPPATEANIWVRLMVARLVRRTDAGSDALLCVADACRDLAGDLVGDAGPNASQRRGLLAIADNLTTLAPTRANPVA